MGRRDKRSKRKVTNDPPSEAERLCKLKNSLGLSAKSDLSQLPEETTSQLYAMLDQISSFQAQIDSMTPDKAGKSSNKPKRRGSKQKGNSNAPASATSSDHSKDDGTGEISGTNIVESSATEQHASSEGESTEDVTASEEHLKVLAKQTVELCLEHAQSEWLTNISKSLVQDVLKSSIVSEASHRIVKEAVAGSMVQLSVEKSRDAHTACVEEVSTQKHASLVIKDDHVFAKPHPYTRLKRKASTHSESPVTTLIGTSKNSQASSVDKGTPMTPLVGVSGKRRALSVEKGTTALPKAIRPKIGPGLDDSKPANLMTWPFAKKVQVFTVAEKNNLGLSAKSDILKLPKKTLEQLAVSSSLTEQQRAVIKRHLYKPVVVMPSLDQFVNGHNSLNRTSTSVQTHLQSIEVNTKIQVPKSTVNPAPGQGNKMQSSRLVAVPVKIQPKPPGMQSSTGTITTTPTILNVPNTAESKILRYVNKLAPDDEAVSSNYPSRLHKALRQANRVFEIPLPASSSKKLPPHVMSTVIGGQIITSLCCDITPVFLEYDREKNIKRCLFDRVHPSGEYAIFEERPTGHFLTVCKEFSNGFIVPWSIGKADPSCKHILQLCSGRRGNSNSVAIGQVVSADKLRVYESTESIINGVESCGRARGYSNDTENSKVSRKARTGFDSRETQMERMLNDVCRKITQQTVAEVKQPAVEDNNGEKVFGHTAKPVSGSNCTERAGNLKSVDSWITDKSNLYCKCPDNQSGIRHMAREQCQKTPTSVCGDYEYARNWKKCSSSCLFQKPGGSNVPSSTGDSVAVGNAQVHTAKEGQKWLAGCVQDVPVLCDETRIEGNGNPHYATPTTGEFDMRRRRVNNPVTQDDNLLQKGDGDEGVRQQFFTSLELKENGQDLNTTMSRKQSDGMTESTMVNSVNVLNSSPKASQLSVSHMNPREVGTQSSYGIYSDLTLRNGVDQQKSSRLKVDMSSANMPPKLTSVQLKHDEKTKDIEDGNRPREVLNAEISPDQKLKTLMADGIEEKVIDITLGNGTRERPQPTLQAQNISDAEFASSAHNLQVTLNWFDNIHGEEDEMKDRLQQRSRGQRALTADGSDLRMMNVHSSCPIGKELSVSGGNNPTQIDTQNSYKRNLVEPNCSDEMQSNALKVDTSIANMIQQSMPVQRKHIDNVGDMVAGHGPHKLFTGEACSHNQSFRALMSDNILKEKGIDPTLSNSTRECPEPSVQTMCHDDKLKVLMSESMKEKGIDPTLSNSTRECPEPSVQTMCQDDKLEILTSEEEKVIDVTVSNSIKEGPLPALGENSFRDQKFEALVSDTTEKRPLSNSISDHLDPTVQTSSIDHKLKALVSDSLEEKVIGDTLSSLTREHPNPTVQSQNISEVEFASRALRPHAALNCFDDIQGDENEMEDRLEQGYHGQRTAGGSDTRLINFVDIQKRSPAHSSVFSNNRGTARGSHSQLSLQVNARDIERGRSHLLGSVQSNNDITDDAQSTGDPASIGHEQQQSGSGTTESTDDLLPHGTSETDLNHGRSDNIQSKVVPLLSKNDETQRTGDPLPHVTSDRTQNPLDLNYGRNDQTQSTRYPFFIGPEHHQTPHGSSDQTQSTGDLNHDKSDQTQSAVDPVCSGHEQQKTLHGRRDETKSSSDRLYTRAEQQLIFSGTNEQTQRKSHLNHDRSDETQSTGDHLSTPRTDDHVYSDHEQQQTPLGRSDQAKSTGDPLYIGPEQQWVHYGRSNQINPEQKGTPHDRSDHVQSVGADPLLHGKSDKTDDHLQCGRSYDTDNPHSHGRRHRSPTTSVPLYIDPEQQHTPYSDNRFAEPHSEENCYYKPAATECASRRLQAAVNDISQCILKVPGANKRLFVSSGNHGNLEWMETLLKAKPDSLVNGIENRASLLYNCFNIMSYMKSYYMELHEAKPVMENLYASQSVFPGQLWPGEAKFERPELLGGTKRNFWSDESEKGFIRKRIKTDIDCLIAMAEHSGYFERLEQSGIELTDFCDWVAGDMDNSLFEMLAKTSLTEPEDSQKARRIKRARSARQRQVSKAKQTKINSMLTTSANSEKERLGNYHSDAQSSLESDAQSFTQNGKRDMSSRELERRVTLPELHDAGQTTKRLPGNQLAGLNQPPGQLGYQYGDGHEIDGQTVENVPTGKSNKKRRRQSPDRFGGKKAKKRGKGWVDNVVATLSSATRLDSTVRQGKGIKRRSSEDPTRPVPAKRRKVSPSPKSAAVRTTRYRGAKRPKVYR